MYYIICQVLHHQFWKKKKKKRPTWKCNKFPIMYSEVTLSVKMVVHDQAGCFITVLVKLLQDAVWVHFDRGKCTFYNIFRHYYIIRCGQFVRCIQDLYTDPTRLKINGHLTDSFKLFRGREAVLAPHFFAIFREPLAQSIRQKELRGISIANEDHLIEHHYLI